MHSIGIDENLNDHFFAARFFLKIPQLIQFFERFGYCEKFPCLEDNNWILTLAFLVDICDHLNVLNLSLQGENILFPDAISKISAIILNYRVTCT